MAHQALLMRNLYDFIYFNVTGEHDFELRFIAKVDEMVKSVKLTQRHVEDDDLKKTRRLCTAIKIILGPVNVIHALFTGPNLRSTWDHLGRNMPSYGHQQDWWNALTVSTDQDISTRLDVGMAFQEYDIVIGCLQQLTGDIAHVVWGSPLFNAIKLQNATFVHLVVKHFARPDMKDEGNRVRREQFHRPDAAFPLKDGIRAAIAHNSAEIVGELLRCYVDCFGKPTNYYVNHWTEAAVQDADVAVLEELLAVRPKNFKLAFPLMTKIMQSCDYQTVFTTFSTIDHPHHEPSAQDPLQIAVRSDSVETVKAIVETGKYNLNAELKSNIPKYSTKNITTLDIAVSRGNLGIVKFLVGKGAYVIQPPKSSENVPLTGRMYDYIREASLRRSDGKSTHLPPYDIWMSMSWRDHELCIES